MASFFRRVTENWKLKTLAFAIAVLLWVVVSAEQVTSNWMFVPLEVQVTDPRFRALPIDSREVEVRFAGPGRDLLDVAVRRPPLRLTISQVDQTTAEYDLSPRMVQLPGQIAVSALDVRPSTVRLNFERLDSREVRVRPRLVDSLGPQWAIVDSLSVDPATIRISGTAAQVGAIREIFTQRFEVTPADTLFERTVRLDTTGLRGIEVSTNTVTISGRVDRVVERVVQGVTVDVGPGVTILPDRVTVRLRGPERTVRAMVPGVFRVVVSIDEIPNRIPAEGLPVPLRIDRLRPGVQAALEPAQARLLPAGARDSVPAADGPPRAESVEATPNDDP